MQDYSYSMTQESNALYHVQGTVRFWALPVSTEIKVAIIVNNQTTEQLC